MRTKKVKPPPRAHEYLLHISRKHDDVHKKDFISFDFRTTKEFLTFKYVLKMETEQTGDMITFKLLGFTAPVSELSASGHAVYSYKMFDFKAGEYHISIERKDTTGSKFRLEIPKGKSQPLKATHIPKDSFIEIITE